MDRRVVSQRNDVDVSISPAIQSLWVKVAPELDLSNEAISFISTLCSNVLHAILRSNQQVPENLLSMENIQQTLNRILSPEMAKDVVSFGKSSVGLNERDSGSESLNEFEIIDDDELSYESAPIVPHLKPNLGTSSLVFSPDLIIQKVFALSGGTIEKNPALYIASALEHIVSKLLQVITEKRAGSTREEVTADELERTIKEDPKLAWFSSLQSESNTPSPLSTPPPSPRKESLVVNNSSTPSIDSHTSTIELAIFTPTTTTTTTTTTTNNTQDDTSSSHSHSPESIESVQIEKSPEEIPPLPTQQQQQQQQQEALIENSFNVSPQRSSPLPRPHSPNSTAVYNYHSLSTFELMVMSNAHRVMAKDKIYPLSIIKETPLQFDNQLLIIFVFLGCLTLNTVFSSSS